MDPKKPVTIDELEAILNSEDDYDIHINPDGTITATPKAAEQMGKILEFRRCDPGQY